MQPADQVLEADGASIQAHTEAVAQAEGTTTEASDLPKEDKTQIYPLTAPSGDDLGIQEASEAETSS